HPGGNSRHQIRRHPQARSALAVASGFFAFGCRRFPGLPRKRGFNFAGQFFRCLVHVETGSLSKGQKPSALQARGNYADETILSMGDTDSAINMKTEKDVSGGFFQKAGGYAFGPYLAARASAMRRARSAPATVSVPPAVFMPLSFCASVADM